MNGSLVHRLLLLSLHRFIDKCLFPSEIHSLLLQEDEARINVVLGANQLARKFKEPIGLNLVAKQRIIQRVRSVLHFVGK